MTDRETKVILTNKSMSNIGKPAQIKIGTLPQMQLNKLLKFVNEYNPEDFLGTKCFCNIHFDTTIVHANGIRPAQQFTPTHPKNKKNEMIIEPIDL